MLRIFIFLLGKYENVHMYEREGMLNGSIIQGTKNMS